MSNIVIDPLRSEQRDAAARALARAFIQYQSAAAPPVSVRSFRFTRKSLRDCRNSGSRTGCAGRARSSTPDVPARRHK